MSPADSKSLSIEVIDLFNRIEQQSLEYTKAFEEINSFFRKAEHSQRQVEEMYSKFLDVYNKNLEIYNKFASFDEYINQRVEDAIGELRRYLDVIVIVDLNKRIEEKKDFRKLRDFTKENL